MSPLDSRTLDALKALGALAREAEPVGSSSNGSLDGMQLGVKDNIAVGGLAHEGASSALTGHVAHADAGSVARLRAAGAGVLLQTNMHELAFGITSANAHTGRVLNPWDRNRVAGGSSGGTAVAVAMGAVPAGLGSDTGGSGRIPAALCGCAGMRPTTGRYPADGVLSLSPSLDTVSAMAVNVATLASVDAVLADDTDNLGSAMPDNTVLGLAAEPFWAGVSSAIAARTHAKIDALVQAGFHKVEIHDPALMRVAAITSAIAGPLVAAEAAMFWQRFSRVQLGLDLAEFVSRIASKDVRQIFEMIAAVADDQASYRILVSQREEACEAMDSIWKRHGVDVLAHPANPAPAPRLDELESITVDGAVQDTFATFTRMRLIASVTATPALALPVGFDDLGLPLGLELVGRTGTDRHLLSVARAVEEHIDESFIPPAAAAEDIHP